MSKPKSDPRKPSFPDRVDGADFELLFRAEREFVAGENPELKALGNRPDMDVRFGVLEPYRL